MKDNYYELNFSSGCCGSADATFRRGRILCTVQLPDLLTTTYKIIKNAVVVVFYDTTTVIDTYILRSGLIIGVALSEKPTRRALAKIVTCHSPLALVMTATRSSKRLPPFFPTLRIFSCLLAAIQICINSPQRMKRFVAFTIMDEMDLY